MIAGPWSGLCGRRTEHPLASSLAVATSSSHPQAGAKLHSGSHSIDFWGPCAVVSIFGALLWLARVRHVPWIFVIWSVASIFNHFICRVHLKPSRLLLHYALLGYSVTVMIPLIALIVLIRPPIWINTLIEALAVCWSSSSAMLSYQIIYGNRELEERQKLPLLLPAIILMGLYFVSLLPTRI
jgi:hypothetical protein